MSTSLTPVELDFDRPEFAGSKLNLAGWAKKVTGRLSMTVGSVGLSRDIYDRDAAVALDNLDAVARRFERGEFDLVAVGRALAHDPAWTRNVRLGLPLATYDVASLRTLGEVARVQWQDEADVVVIGSGATGLAGGDRGARSGRLGHRRRGRKRHRAVTPSERRKRSARRRHERATNNTASTIRRICSSAT